MAHITLTKDNFAQEVLRSEKPVLVDFWASWCGPCMALAPTIDEIANEQSVVTVGKVNVDDEADLARQYRIMSIPTLMLFKDGEVVRREVGGKSKGEILQMMGLVRSICRSFSPVTVWSTVKRFRSSKLCGIPLMIVLEPVWVVTVA